MRARVSSLKKRKILVKAFRMFTTIKFLAMLLEGEEQTIEAIEIQLADPDLTPRQGEMLRLLRAGYMVRREQLLAQE